MPSLLRRALLTITLAAVTLAGAKAQRFPPTSQTSSQTPSAPTLSVRSAADGASSLTIPVFAFSPAGTSVRDLDASQLVVKLAGHRLPSADLHLERSAPASLLIVLDAINTAPGDLLHAVEGLRAFLLEREGHLAQPTSVLIVADHKISNPDASPAEQRELARRELFVTRFPSTEDGHQLDRALTGLDPGLRRITPAQGGEGAAEQVSLSLKAIAFLADAEAAVPGAKLVVWISPGWPLLAGSAGLQQHLFDTITFFSGVILRAKFVLDALDPEPVTRIVSSNSDPAPVLRPGFGSGDQHSLGAPTPSGPGFWQTFAAPVRSARDASPNNLALNVLAVQSGGNVLDQQHSVQQHLDTCARDASALRLLTLPPPQSSSRQLTWEPLAVQSSRHDLRFQTRPGLYAANASAP